MSMCFVLELFTSFWAMKPAPMLSMYVLTGSFTGMISSISGYGRLLGDEEVEEGAVVKDTAAGERLPVSVVAGPVGVRLDAQ
eukprot:2004870-Pyramimonas_sp.AAC.1